jgi:multiple sugar transport system ATP-binding protein
MFVAGFIGSPAMNFLRGTVEPDGTALALNGGISLPLPAPAGSGGELVLGIRPEHLSIGGEAGIPARITNVEPTGSETFIQAETGGQRLAALVHERIAVRPGETIRFAVQPGMSHLFAADSGKRIEIQAS